MPAGRRKVSAVLLLAVVLSDLGVVSIHPLKNSIPQLGIDSRTISCLHLRGKKLLEMVPAAINLLRAGQTPATANQNCLGPLTFGVDDGSHTQVLLALLTSNGLPTHIAVCEDNGVLLQLFHQAGVANLINALRGRLALLCSQNQGSWSHDHPVCASLRHAEDAKEEQKLLRDFFPAVFGFPRLDQRRKALGNWGQGQSSHAGAIHFDLATQLQLSTKFSAESSLSLHEFVIELLNRLASSTTQTSLLRWTGRACHARGVIGLGQRRTMRWAKTWCGVKAAGSWIHQLASSTHRYVKEMCTYDREHVDHLDIILKSRHVHISTSAHVCSSIQTGSSET